MIKLLLLLLFKYYNLLKTKQYTDGDDEVSMYNVNV